MYSINKDALGLILEKGDLSKGFIEKNKSLVILIEFLTKKY